MNIVGTADERAENVLLNFSQGTRLYAQHIINVDCTHSRTMNQNSKHVYLLPHGSGVVTTNMWLFSTTICRPLQEYTTGVPQSSLLVSTDLISKSKQMMWGEYYVWTLEQADTGMQSDSDKTEDHSRPSNINPWSKHTVPDLPQLGNFIAVRSICGAYN